MMLRDKMRWTYYSDLLLDEYRECELEGRLVSSFLPEIDEVLKLSPENNREERARELLSVMEVCPIAADYPYVEPESYEDICQSLSSEACMVYPVADDVMKDKLSGAWYGRIVS